MTNDATYREKGRALFLAAMMVLSVVAMSAAFAGAAAAHNHNYDDAGPTYDATAGDSIDEIWIGQEVTLIDDTDADGIEVYEGLNPDTSDDSPVSTLQVDSDGEATLDSAQLEEGQPYTIDSVGGDWDEETFWVISEDLDVDFDSSTVSEDGDVTVEFESDREHQWVNVSASDLDGEEVADLFDVGEDHIESIETDEDRDVVSLEIINVDDDVEFEANFANTDIEIGEYEFAFNVTDSFAEDTATIEVTDDAEDREFINVDSVEEGEIGNITIDVGNSDSAAFSFGDGDEGHVANLTLENFDTDNNEVVLEYNTYLAGNYDDSWTDAEDAAEEAGWTAHNATITDIHVDTGLSEDELLPSETWDLEIGSVGDDADSTDFIEDSDDRDLFTISDRSAPGDAVTQTAPHADGVDDLDEYEDSTITETGTIAVEDGGDGDSLFLTIDEFGANGSIAALADALDEDPDFDPIDGVDFGEQLYEETGIAINISEQDAGAVGSVDYWNSSYADTDGNGEPLPISAYTLDLDDYDNHDDYAGSLIFEIDYQNADGFDVDDETYNIEFTIDETYSNLIDEDYTDAGEISFEEPEIEWKEIDELEASSEANVSGTTNVAPGSEIRAVADSPSDEGAFVETDDAVVVAGDGINTFTATFDLSDEQVGVLFEITGEEPLADEDDTLEDVRLVEAEDDDDDDEDEPEEGLGLSVDYDDIEEGDTAEIDTTVDNHGENETTVDVVLEIDGETHEESLEIDGGDSASHTFAVENLSVGDYDFTVTVEDDEFDEEYDGTISVSEEGAPDDDDDDDDTDADDDDDDDDDDDGTPGFGVAVALVALLAAAMLALRRQD
ncbi:BGTF surface domain-containing protein [Halostagnicola sp. A-GB9-2]|uniref:BGTF surface domain-containing protein n=1 Tax=Halostagnicola sp. A-GB9-2 TaxID=3048066 RepID=UPI0024BFC6C5|nr:BGTF surface domain-containing protein [Halostagnicola sp. A-GB9-2]MDJ1432596.1 PGF-CTERM sorting domain-containing protein [Halostagnicola sp. A-GB9-2]